MKIFVIIAITAISFGCLGYIAHDFLSSFFENTELASPFVMDDSEPEKPLLAYSIENLKKYSYQNSSIQIERGLTEAEDYTAYLFSYTTLNKKMTGQLNVPKNVSLTENSEPKVILLIRGYAPLNTYTTGVGTRNAAAAFAKEGYITVAPDFFGYGESDPEPTDTWQARFEKPITIIELIKTIEAYGVPTEELSIINSQLQNSESNTINNSNEQPKPTLKPTSSIGIWAHSNGGQIALATLQILGRPLPTTLWAPVTAPFPYSILYFTDEEADEGKAARKTVSLFEDTYDVFDFSLTQHLNSLTGPFQLHHGTADEAAPIIWSDDFVQKVEAENKRRLAVVESLERESATESGRRNQKIDTMLIEPITFEYFRYPGADHNLQPGWSEVIARDIEFFVKNL